MTCPACGGTTEGAGVYREHLVTMQNRVFDSRAEGMNALAGTLALETCGRCGLTFNAQFDDALVTYDRAYDNRVPSRIFQSYYEQLAAELASILPLEGRLVVDVGCGKGGFLRTICAASPGIRGLGIDPSYDADLHPLPNLTFVPEMFAAHHVQEAPALVVCRHVLEHMPRPTEFLRSIRAVLESCPDTPFMLEVPDLSWIVRAEAFWDFCYEHCNYFTQNSLENVAREAGFRPTRIQTAFGGQYLWLIGNAQQASTALKDAEADRTSLREYARSERRLIDAMRAKLERNRADGIHSVVWGMATKGVVFCNLVDFDGDLIDVCVDINVQKQGKYIPKTGHRIEPPSALARFAGRRPQVIVMNPNYFDEIAGTCRELGVSPDFMDASGAALRSPGAS